MEKPVMVVGLDESDHSFYALEWALDHFFAPNSSSFLFKLVLAHAKPTPASAIGIVGPGTVEVLPHVLPHIESDLKRIAARVIDKGKEICVKRSVDVEIEVEEGDARNVLCEAVEKHNASMLVLGSHGYGAIKRAVLGSVSDYCAHHAHSSVMIVKTPKMKH